MSLHIEAISASKIKDTGGFGNRQDPYAIFTSGASTGRTEPHWDSKTEPRWKEKLGKGCDRNDVTLTGSSFSVVSIVLKNDNRNNKLKSKEDTIIDEADFDVSDAVSNPGEVCFVNDRILL